ncbi:MAG: DUF4180 domain-containing protein [Eubacteriales bacterium]|jgi:hypothetical protein|nr:DUF4180 domain-containing protein [Eubacteriales bacterium]
MNIHSIQQNGEVIAQIETEETLITDVQSALDLMATVRYETVADRMILPKAALDERFFLLSSGLAGDILQKFVNYQLKVAIVGDFSGYTSKPLRDFIYESNNASHVFFVATVKEAVEKLSRV